MHWLPSVTEIAARSGLSRQTVNKHFKDMKSQGFLNDIIDGSSILIDSVLATLYKLGTQSRNVKALQVFLDWHKEIQPRITHKNYIQINNLVVTEDDIKALSPEKLIQLENIINSS